MKRHLRLPLIIIALTAPTLAMAVETAGRYTMTPTKDGFMRLDTESGAVSICKNTSGRAVCELAEDGAGRYAKQIDDLKRENQKLRADVKRLEQHFGLGPADKNKPNDLAPPAPPSGSFKVPQKEDVDQMFNYIEGMLNKFRERLRRLEKEPKPETPL